jgi:hypothetical protein
VILVRLVMQAQFGHADEIARVFRETNDALTRALGLGGQGWRALTGRGWRILTDLTGPFDTVVLELEVGSLAEWERLRREVFDQPVFRDAVARTAGLVATGRTEFYTIVAEG